MHEYSKWPEELPLGKRSVDKFAPCCNCWREGMHPSITHTFVYYGGKPLCLACAQGIDRGE